MLPSSHLIGEVAGVADDLVIIANGRVVRTGTLAEVTAGHGDLEETFFALTGGAPGVGR